MPERRLPDRETDRVLRFLEAAAPWIVAALVFVMVLVALLAAVLGAPWTR